MTVMEPKNAGEESTLVEPFEDNSATVKTDMHEHHHSDSGDKHSHHHHSSKHNRWKRKVKRFIKKNKHLLINIAVFIVAMVTCIGLVAFGGTQYRAPENVDQPQNSTKENDTQVTTGSIQIEVPLFTEEVSLIPDSARAYLNRDISVPVEDVIDRYKEEGERLDIGLPVTLSFDVKGMPAGYSVTSTTIEVSEDASFTQSCVYTLKVDEQSVDVYYLKTNAQYYYRIHLTLSDRSVTSVQGSFKTADTPRILSVEGLVNVRDIGGWKTTDGKTIKQGLLYRGSELDGAVEPTYSITANGKNDMLTIFGIRTDMDLRATTDNVYGTDPLGANVEHIYYNAPMYVGAFTNTRAIKEIFSDLADASKYPVYLHCTYGRDRTGTVCYLLEALLGVDEDDLMRDYEAAALYFGGVEAEQMADFVATLKTYDGTTMQERVEGYLLSIGVTADEVASIRDIFLEG